MGEQISGLILMKGPDDIWSRTTIIKKPTHRFHERVFPPPVPHHHDQTTIQQPSEGGVKPRTRRSQFDIEVMGVRIAPASVEGNDLLEFRSGLGWAGQGAIAVEYSTVRMAPGFPHRDCQ